MGIDLHLFPIDCLHEQRLGGVFGFSHTVLNVPRNGEAFESMLRAGEPIPAGITGLIAGRGTDGEHKYGSFTKDPYGEPYRWVDAGDLAPWLFEYYPGLPTTEYIARLPSNTKIILGWH